MLSHSLMEGLASTILLLPLVNAGLIKARNGTATCKYIPGDAAWPTQDAWNLLNHTVGGRLIATIPQAAVCHVGGYATLKPNEAACEALQPEWDFPQTLYVPSVSRCRGDFLTSRLHSEPFSGEIMNPYYQNQSCDPYTPANRTCELGNYVSYSIAVSGADHVISGIKFAKDNNVRLVIKNTGHE